jgi:hypothetical protein
MRSWLGFGSTKKNEATAAAAQAAARDAALAAQPAIDRVNRITDAFIGTYLDPVYALLNQDRKILVFSSPTEDGAKDAQSDPVSAIRERITTNDALYAKIKAILQVPFPATRADGANAAARNVPDGTSPFNNPVSDESVMKMLACMYEKKVIKDCSKVAKVPTWYFYYPLKNNADIKASLCFKALLAPIIALPPVVAAAVEDIEACSELANEYAKQMSVAERDALQGMGAGGQGGGRRPKGRKTRGKRHPKRRGSRRH